MTTIISVNSLTTLKSQLVLDPADVIGIRDTVDNSASVGINTIGDFQGYYISTTRPTYQSPFVGVTVGPEGVSDILSMNDVALANNVRGNQLGETFTEQLYVKNAKVTVQEYPSTPLIINGATANVTETYTPSLVPTDASLTYNLDYPINIQSASLNTTLGKIQQVKATKVEIIPTIDLRWIIHQSTTSAVEGIAASWRDDQPVFDSAIVELDPVDVSSLLNLDTEPILGNNPGNLLVVFYDNNNKGTPEFPIRILSPKILNGQMPVPLYYAGAGRYVGTRLVGTGYLLPSITRAPLSEGYPAGKAYCISREITYSGDDWFSIAAHKIGRSNICGRWPKIHYAAGRNIGDQYQGPYVDFGRENTSYVVRITYSDGTVSTGSRVNFNTSTPIQMSGDTAYGAITGIPYINGHREPANVSPYNTFSGIITRYNPAENPRGRDLIYADNNNKFSDATIIKFSPNGTSIVNRLYPAASPEWNGTVTATDYFSKYFYIFKLIPLSTETYNGNFYGYFVGTSQQSGTIVDGTTSPLIDIVANNSYKHLLRTSGSFPCATPALPPSTNLFFTINKTVTIPLNSVFTSAIDTITSSLNVGLIEFNPVTNLISGTITKGGVGESNTVLVSQADLVTVYGEAVGTPTPLAGGGYTVGQVIVSPTNTSTLTVNFTQGVLSDTKTTTFRTGETTGSISITDEGSAFIRQVVIGGADRANVNSPITFQELISSGIVPSTNYSNSLTVAPTATTFDLILPRSTINGGVYYYNGFPTHGGCITSLKLNFSYAYNYVLTGVQYNSTTPPNTDIISSGDLNFIENGVGGYYVNFSADNPSQYSILVNEELNIAPFLRGIIRPDYSISYPDTVREESTVYGTVVSRYPIVSGFTTVDYLYQGRGSGVLTQDLFSEFDSTIKLGFEIKDSSIPNIFSQVLLLPQTYDVTAFLNQKLITDGGITLSIPASGITYNVSGGIDAFGISAADLRYSRPEMSTLSYSIEVERGFAPYNLYPGAQSVYNGYAGDSILIDAPRGEFYQKIFSNLDREKNYTSTQLSSGITTLYFTTVSINKAGYTFTEIPFPISNLSSNETYKYKIHNSVNFPGSFTSEGYNTDVSKLINIDDYTLVRTTGKYGFNSISYPPTVSSPLVRPERQTLFDKYCIYETVVDPTTGDKNINTITINPDGQTGPIVNKFFNLDYMYTLNDPDLTNTLAVFITPIVETVPPAPPPPPPTPPRPLPPTPPAGPTAGIASYPFWMTNFLQNADGSITGIPTLDTSFLQNLRNDYRTFPVQTFNSDYFSNTNNAFSLDGKYGTDYLVGNSFMALQNLTSTTTLEATYPWQKSNGSGGFIDAVGSSVPQAFKDGFIANDYRFKSKFFSIQTDLLKQLYVLPFRRLPASTGYNFIYSSSVITLLHRDVNVSSSMSLQWPVGISKLPAAKGRMFINGYNIPSPLTVNPADRSYSPIIDARPGYIRVTLPFEGLVLNNVAAAGRLQYYTPYGAITSQNLLLQTRSFTTIHPTNPSFFLVYKGIAYNTIFSRGATGYSVTVTSSTPQVSNASSLFGAYLYSDQVYSDLYIQSLISPDVGVQVPNVIKGTDITTYYASGSYVLPKFYIPIGLKLDTTTNMFTGQASTEVLGSSADITVDLSLEMLKFEGVPVGYAAATSKPRFAISSLGVANTVGNIQEFAFDLTDSANNTFTLRGLEPLTTYTGFVLSYFPYVSDANPVLQAYSEKVNINLTFTTSNGGKISGVCTSNIVTTNPRSYALTVSDVKFTDSSGSEKTANETLSVLGGGNYRFVLDMSDSSLSSQPYMLNAIKSTNYSTNGVLYVPVDVTHFSIVSSGLRFQFSVSNLLAGASYTPKFYLVDITDTDIRSRPLTFPSAITIPPRGFMSKIIRTPTLSVYTGTITYSGFDVYDSLIQGDYSLIKDRGGSIRLVNVSDIRSGANPQPSYYGVLDVPPTTTTRFTVPINRNLLPNISYNLVPAYNALPHDPYGWNHYTTTDFYGDRSLRAQGGQTGINYLQNTILPYTGLTVNDGVSLCGFLGPNAVMFGSSILYAYLGSETSTFPEVERQPRDVDIMVNDQTVLNSMVEFIINSGSAQSGVSINDPYRLYTGATGGVAGYTLAFGSPNGNAISMLASSAVPTGASMMGPLTIVTKPSPSIPAITNKYGIDADIQILNITLTSTSPSISFKSIQFIFVRNQIPPSFTLAEYAQYNSDFTVNAGTFDGTQMVMPYYQDVAQRIAVYLDPILPSTRSRMIRRMQKMIDRGFTIFLQSQSQINGWNTIPVSSDPVDPWWTDATTLVKFPTFKKPFKPINSCPFRVLNRLSVVAPDSLSVRFTAPRWNSFAASTDFESFVYTSISSTRQPSFGGQVVVNGFNYQKFSATNSIPSSIPNGRLTVTNNTGTIVYGFASVGSDTFPKNITIPMNQAYVPSGSQSMKLIYSWDEPTKYGLDTPLFTYVAVDDILPEEKSVPLIRNISVSVQPGTILGGSSVDVTQPLIQFIAQASGVSLTYNAGTTYNRNDLRESVDQTFLYRLTGTDTGDPVYGNGWENTSTYLKYRRAWSASETYAIGDIVKYNNAQAGDKLYICTGDVNRKIPPAAPESVDVNTGLLSAWSTDLVTKTLNVAYSAGYTGTIQNCLPNTEYDVYMRYQTGTAFSPLQLVSKVRTLPENIVVDKVATANNVYTVKEAHYAGSAAIFNNGLISSGGATYLANTTSVLPLGTSRFITYQPQASLSTNVYDVSNQYTLDYINFVFTSLTNTITDIQYDSALLRMEPTTTYSFNTNDSIVFVPQTAQQLYENALCVSPIGSTGLVKDGNNPRYIDVRITGMTSNTTYNLNAYYVFAGSTQLQSQVNLPQFKTRLDLGYQITNSSTSTDFIVYIRSFIYDGSSIAGVFPYDNPSNSVVINAYSSTSSIPIKKYTVASVVVNGNTALFNTKIVDSAGNSVNASVLDMYDLTYTYAEANGQLKIIQKNGLRYLI